MSLLPLTSNLTVEEVHDYYGHGYLETDIRSLYPYDDRDFQKGNYDSTDYMITYDPLTAMSLRMKNIPIAVWGTKIQKQSQSLCVQKNKSKGNNILEKEEIAVLWQIKIIENEKEILDIWDM